MAPKTLEQGVERIERIVERMQEQSFRAEPRRDDWQATTGAFSGDPTTQEIIDEAVHLCAEERQLTR